MPFHYSTDVLFDPSGPQLLSVPGRCQSGIGRYEFRMLARQVEQITILIG